MLCDQKLKRCCPTNPTNVFGPQTPAQVSLNCQKIKVTHSKNSYQF